MFHRRALEDTRQDARQSKDDDEDETGPTCSEEAGTDEEADVEEKDADFCQADVDLVEDLGDEVELSC